MAKTRIQKEVIVSELAQKLSSMKSAALVSVDRFTMPDADALRVKGREAGVEFAVAKKTLLSRAASQAGIAIDVLEFPGSVLIGIGQADEVAPAKLLKDVLRTHERMAFMGGVLSGVRIDAVAVSRLAALPSKLELLAKAVGSIQAPMSGLANVLAGNLRGLVRVLDGIAKAKT